MIRGQPPLPNWPQISRLTVTEAGGPCPAKSRLDRRGSGKKWRTKPLSDDAAALYGLCTGLKSEGCCLDYYHYEPADFDWVGPDRGLHRDLFCWRFLPPVHQQPARLRVPHLHHRDLCGRRLSPDSRLRKKLTQSRYGGLFLFNGRICADGLSSPSDAIALTALTVARTSALDR